MHAFEKEVKEEYNIKLLGDGGGLDRINSFSFTFSTNQKLDINFSRKLFVELSSEILTRVNKNEEIVPYLIEYPFTARHLDSLFFCLRTRKSEFPRYVSALGITDTYNLVMN